ncbi:hypothetical protein [Sphingomonas sp. LT1P40]
MNIAPALRPATPPRAPWTRPTVQRLNASHAQIGTRPENEDGAFSTS